MKLAIKPLLKRIQPHIEFVGIAAWITLALGLIALKRHIFPMSPPRAFLVNNLFLGMLPWIFSELTRFLLPSTPRSLRRLFFLFSFCIWLLFLPNSLYVFTDIVHLQSLRKFRFYVLEIFSFPYWLDLIIFLNFGMISFYLGLHSIFQWHQILRTTLSAKRRTGLLGLIFLLVGVGVYLGRFIRLFSWDALINPNFILVEVMTLLSYPYALTFSLTLSLTYAASYFVIFVPRLEYDEKTLRSTRKV